MSVVLNLITIIGVVTSLILQNFSFQNMDKSTTISFYIAVCFILISVPSFASILMTILNDIESETCDLKKGKVVYRNMFNGLQEGLIVIQNKNITFMNELSNKILSSIAQVKNFARNKFSPQKDLAPIDMPLFHVYDQRNRR